MNFAKSELCGLNDYATKDVFSKWLFQRQSEHITYSGISISKNIKVIVCLTFRTFLDVILKILNKWSNLGISLRGCVKNECLTLT